MGPLLVVLVTACALTGAVQIGRGFWVRTRSVERHQQALDTLADITQSPDPAPEARQLAPDHQAHVRVIGPAGPVTAEPGLLPPPRPFARSSPVGASPMRRPSRNAPSAAAIDAVSASATLGRSSGTRLVRTRLPHPPAGPLAASEEPTLPALTPPPPAALEPPTRPVPVIRPHVFYFDDVAARPAARAAREAQAPVANDIDDPDDPDDGTGGPDLTALAVVPVGAGDPSGASEFLPPHRGRSWGLGGKDRRPVALRALTAAAAVVVIGAAVTGAALALQSPSPKAATQALRPPHKAGKPSAPAAKPATPTSRPTVPVTTTTTPPPPPAPKAAVLLNASGGTATYQLTSPSASIVVTASGPCWIEVKARSAAGQVVYEGILAKGQTSSVTGPAWIRLGDPPYAAVTVNGKHMSVPGATAAVPLNLQFTLG
jgi:hypothetical protein